LLCQGLSPQEETWGLLASAWARQGETQKAAQWLRQVEGWDLLLKVILSGLLRCLGNFLGAATSSYLSFLLAQEPRILGALSLLLPILARDFFVLNVFVNIHKPPAHPAHGVQMVEMQMQPSEETIAACVAACSKSGDPATAVARCWDWWRWVSCGFFSGNLKRGRDW
jgi:hypothetical protein